MLYYELNICIGTSPWHFRRWAGLCAHTRRRRRRRKKNLSVSEEEMRSSEDRFLCVISNTCNTTLCLLLPGYNWMNFHWYRYLLSKRYQTQLQMQQLPELMLPVLTGNNFNRVKWFFVSLLARNSFNSKCSVLLLSCILYWIKSPTLRVALVYDFKDEATYLSKITLTSLKSCDSFIITVTTY